MLAGIFRTNKNPVLLILLLLAPLLWGLSIYEQTNHGISQGMPGYAILLELLSKVAILPALFGLILALVIALVSNAIYNELELFERRDQLSALFFIVFIALSDNALTADPALCALPFLLIALRKLFTLGDSKFPLRVLFDAGLLLGIGAFFYLPLIFFVIPFIILIPLLGILNWRSILSVSIGTATPFMLYWLGMIAMNKDFEFSYWIPEDTRSNGYLLWSVVTLIVLFVASIPFIIKSYNRSIMRTKNMKAGLAGVMLVCAVLALLDIIAKRQSGFTMLALPAAYYVSYLFRSLRSNIIIELLFTLVLALAFWMQWSFINP